MTDGEHAMVPPATVFLPTAGRPAADGEHQVLVRDVADMQIVITAYSDLDQLVLCCGPEQSWVQFDWDLVEDLREQLDALVVLDLPSYDNLEDFVEAAATSLQRRDGSERANNEG